MKSTIFLLAATATIFGLGGASLVPALCEPPTEITTHPSGAVTYPGNVTVTINIDKPECDAHKSPLTVTYPGGLTINPGKRVFYSLYACHRKSHMVQYATNSSGWEVENKTAGTLEGKHTNTAKKAWFKFDLDFAVTVDADQDDDDDDEKRNDKRSLGIYSSLDEAFDIKVPGCKDNTEVDLEFGVGNATTLGTWTDDAAEVTLEGEFGSGKGDDGGKYTAVFKTDKEVPDASSADDTTKDTADQSESGTSGAAGRELAMGSVLLGLVGFVTIMW